MKILIISATHGDELLGIKLQERLLRQRSPLLEHVEFIIGNPKALIARKRYIETDLNRAYGSSDHTYETKRALEIQNYIHYTRPDLVIDMHTTTCEQPDCLILHNLNGLTKRRFLRACHVDTVLKVQPLGDIETLGNFIVAYEVPKSHITIALLDAIAADIQRFVADEVYHTHKNVYKMTGKIFKSEVTEEQIGQMVNFKTSTLGFIPVMVGENSYKRQTNYLGFKTTVPERIEV